MLRRSEILGVFTYTWTPHGRKLGVSRHGKHQWIDTCDVNAHNVTTKA